MAKIGAGVLERFYYAYAEYRASPLVFKHSVHPPQNQQELTEVLYKSKMMGTPEIIIRPAAAPIAHGTLQCGGRGRGRTIFT